jgi:hypothetical protein
MSNGMHQPQQSGGFDQLDDMDRLLARLDRAQVPDDLTARVLASTVARTTATRAVLAWPWMIVGVAALSVLTAAGYQIGASLASTDGLELVGAIFGDFGLLATAPGDVFAALNEVIPWTIVVMAALSAALLILAAGNIVSRSPMPLRARRLA